MTWERIEELTTDVSFLVVRALSLTPSSQEIEKRKSSSSPIPGFDEPFRSFVYLVYYKGFIVLRVNGTDSVPGVGGRADCLTNLTIMNVRRRTEP
jgi:hypothetical protein